MNALTHSPANKIGEANDPIGVFDSGFGGLTVLRELKRELPAEKFIYLGDTARTPYGPRGRETILRYSCECGNFLNSRQRIKLLVVACNTASSVALEGLRKIVPCPVVGTINQAVIMAADGGPNSKVGVIGTEATIASGVYQTALAARRSDLSISAAACPLFVPLVEQGMFEGEIVDKIVEYYLAPMRDENIGTLVLGCTHYPLLKDAIDKYMQGKTRIVECSKSVALEVKQLLTESSLLRTVANESGDEFFVTDGVAKFNSLGAMFLKNGPISAIKVENL